MNKFQGFTEKETFTQIPDSFFRQLLNEIDDSDELKVTLYALWRVEHMGGRVRFLRWADFTECAPDPTLALEKAVQRGSLLRALPRATSRAVQNGVETLYFLNSPRGRAAAEAFAKGQWSPDEKALSAPPPERPNVFKLYEENIGPLTPLIADALKDAEQTYSPDWIEEAIGEAVRNNKRNWKYVEAILRRWKEEGHAEKQNRRDSKETRGRDVTRKVEDFLKR